MVKTRFAPSPTGYVHIGNLRTALFEYLFAKKNNGIFLLRIEDTDRERFVPDAVKKLLNTLKWVGIKIDEGVTLNEKNEVIQVGSNGPYIQSEKLNIYQKYSQELLDKGDAYYCFCSKERLDDLRKSQELNKQATGYDKRCRNIPYQEAKNRVNNGESYVIRMKMPLEGVTVIHDLIRGDVEYQNNLIDDQILLKADGFPTYHFAVVIDDHIMEMTHILRADEWLPSTPKHITLYKMFGWKIPEYAHLSLLINKEKKKLSKRHGDVAVEDFMKKGYLPEALINFIAFLGWNPGDEREVFNLTQLEQEFDLTKVSKAPAVFNVEKLNWYNKHYIMSLSSDELAKRCEPFFTNAGINIEGQNLAQIVELEKGRSNTLVEIVENTRFIFAQNLEYDPELLIWKKSTKEDAKNKLEMIQSLLQNYSEGEWLKEKLEAFVLDWIKNQDFGNGDVLWPTRVALSGLKNSPGPFELMSVLGKEQTIQRILKAINYL